MKRSSGSSSSSKKKKSIVLGSTMTMKKSRMREAKETKILFENIAKKLLINSETMLLHKMEGLAMDIANKKYMDLRQDIIMIESSLSSRMNQLEHKVNDINLKVNDISNDIIKQNSLLREDISKLSSQAAANIESERSKRHTSLKKIQSYIDTTHEQMRGMITTCSDDNIHHYNALRDEHNESIKNLHVESIDMMKEVRGDVSKEISGLKDTLIKHNESLLKIKETVDDMLLKRYGFMPGNKFMAENLSASYNQGVDAGLILDNLSVRIKNLEGYLNEDDDDDNGNSNGKGVNINNNMNSSVDYSSFSPIAHGISKKSSIHNIASPSKSTQMMMMNNFQKKLSNNRINKIEEHLFMIDQQIADCESSIEQIKSTVLSQLRKLPTQTSSASLLSPHHHPPHTNDHPYGGIMNNNNNNGGSSNMNEKIQKNSVDIKALHRRVKKLTENTAKACKTLSHGVTDIQQATLNLYTWTDATYDAFGKVSTQLGYSSNVCKTRARIYIPNTNMATTEQLFHDL